MANFATPDIEESKLAHSIEDAACASDTGRATIYAAIKAGELKARKLIIAVTLLLKGVRLLLWSSNAGHHSAAVLRGVAGRVIAFAERLAGVPDWHDVGANQMLEGKCSSFREMSFGAINVEEVR